MYLNKKNLNHLYSSWNSNRNLWNRPGIRDKWSQIREKQCQISDKRNEIWIKWVWTQKYLGLNNGVVTEIWFPTTNLNKMGLNIEKYMGLNNGGVIEIWFPTTMVWKINGFFIEIFEICRNWREGNLKKLKRRKIFKEKKMVTVRVKRENKSNRINAINKRENVF